MCTELSVHKDKDIETRMWERYVQLFWLLGICFTSIDSLSLHQNLRGEYSYCWQFIDKKSKAWEDYINFLQAQNCQVLVEAGFQPRLSDCSTHGFDH